MKITVEFLHIHDCEIYGEELKNGFEKAVELLKMTVVASAYGGSIGDIVEYGDFSMEDVTDQIKQFLNDLED